MPAKQFTPTACAAILARLEIGRSFSEAATGAGIKLTTARGWRARGANEDSGPYHDFAMAVEATVARQAEPMTAQEHRLKVAEVARQGNVQALKLYWEMIRADQGADEAERPNEDPIDEVDELSHRRAERAGAV